MIVVQQTRNVPSKNRYLATKLVKNLYSILVILVTPTSHTCQSPLSYLSTPLFILVNPPFHTTHRLGYHVCLGHGTSMSPKYSASQRHFGSYNADGLEVQHTLFFILSDYIIKLSIVCDFVTRSD